MEQVQPVGMKKMPGQDWMKRTPVKVLMKKMPAVDWKKMSALEAEKNLTLQRYLHSSAAERDLRPLFLEEELSSFKRSTRLLTESSLSGLRTSCILEEEVGTGEDSDLALT